MKTPHRRAHRIIWSLLVFVLPALLVTGLVLKQSRDEAQPAVQLEPAKGAMSQ